MSRVLQAVDSIHQANVYCLALVPPNYLPKVGPSAGCGMVCFRTVEGVFCDPRVQINSRKERKAIG